MLGAEHSTMENPGNFLKGLGVIALLAQGSLWAQAPVPTADIAEKQAMAPMAPQAGAWAGPAGAMGITKATPAPKATPLAPDRVPPSASSMSWPLLDRTPAQCA